MSIADRLRRLLRRPSESDTAAFRHLMPGHHYRVVRAFADHDGVHHPVGEGWVFQRHTFLPYEDGLSLFVDIGTTSRQIRLQWRPDAEGPIIDRLKDYVSPTSPAPGHVVIALTRDSVCMADDIDAPHDGVIEVDPAADVVAGARAILAAGYLAWVGSLAIFTEQSSAVRS